MRILNTAQMRAADRHATDARGVPSLALMEQAGRRVVEAIDVHFDGVNRVTVLCGRGNNGGDGWVIARLLRGRGIEVEGLLFAKRDDVSGDARANLERARKCGVPLTEVLDEDTWNRCGPEVGSSDVVVDAVVGTGLNKPLTGLLEVVVRDINAAGSPVVAVDVPSGLSSDASHPIGPHLRATLTVTFAAPKLPHVLQPASEAVGQLVVADIGIPPSVIDDLGDPHVILVTRSEARRLVPTRSAAAHKGDFGRVTIVAGSAGKTGAAQLAGLGALRAGAGLVTLATPTACLAHVTHIPEYMTHGLPDHDGVVTGKGLGPLLEAPHDVIAAGPGLGTGPGPRAVVDTLLARTGSAPLVLDADALNVYADDGADLRGRTDGPVIITPHPGELARLTKSRITDIQHDRLSAACDFATAQSLYVVLKGAQTVLATPDGAVFVNTTGNPGMATGGSGDVLTGVVAAWLGQIDAVSAAVRLAVYLHGHAGDLAAVTVGETALIASDVAEHLGHAVADLTRPDDVS